MVRGGSRRSGGGAPLAKDPARYKVPDPDAAPFFPAACSVPWIPLDRVGTRAQRCCRPPVMYSRPPDCASQRIGAPSSCHPNPFWRPTLSLQTELCSTWIRSGGCPYGHKCQFAHGVDELRARQALLATRNPNHLRRTLSDLRCRRTNPLHTRPRSAGRSHEAADAPTVPGAALCTATSWRRSSSLCCDSWTRVRRCSCSYRCHSRNHPRRACAVLARRT